MNTAEALPTRKQELNRAGTPPGPKGSLIMGVMREFNRDTLGFVTRCRDYGDVGSHAVSLGSRLLSLQPERHRIASDDERQELPQGRVT